MIILFTDFGLIGPYTGQVKMVLARQAPGIAVIDLFADAPARDPRASAYLLAAYSAEVPVGSVVMAVVDPGVGSARRALMVHADGRIFVGPDNGLFELIRRRSASFAAAAITWRPPTLSASFHGRDLFAPVAARLARGEQRAAIPIAAGLMARADWPDDLPEVIYIDVFGNAVTGLRAGTLPSDAVLTLGDRRIGRARTFGDVGPGEAFWYENANGLAEIAVNMGRADVVFGLRIGSEIGIG